MGTASTRSVNDTSSRSQWSVTHWAAHSSSVIGLIRHDVLDVGIFLLGTLHPPTRELRFSYQSRDCGRLAAHHGRPGLLSERAHGWGSVLSNVLGNPFLFSHRLIGYNIIHVGISLSVLSTHPPASFAFAIKAAIAAPVLPRPRRRAFGCPRLPWEIQKPTHTEAVPVAARGSQTK